MHWKLCTGKKNVDSNGLIEILSSGKRVANTEMEYWQGIKFDSMRYPDWKAMLYKDNICKGREQSHFSLNNHRLKNYISNSNLISEISLKELTYQ